MAGDALTASTGLYLDDLNKIRVLEPEIAAETETLKVLKIKKISFVSYMFYRRKISN